MGVKTTTSSEIHTVSQLDTELKQFYDFCKENKLSDADIATICKPLLPDVKEIRSKILVYSSIIVAVFVVLYLLSYSEIVQWHYSAFVRIFLIELLPVWNWKDLGAEKCVINNFEGESERLVRGKDCTFCEYIHNIDVMDAGDADLIYRKYVKAQKPVILENGMAHWINPLHENLDKFVAMLVQDEILANSHPCKFKSNIYYGAGNLHRSLRDIRDFPSYFVQFQNCEFEAVKALRKYVPRPKFLAAEIRPVQYSWILFSRGYDVEKLKPIFFSDQITIMGQLIGRTDVLLQPADCHDECEQLKIDLARGEVLIFGGPWTMDYRPGVGDQNLAIILESH